MIVNFVSIFLKTYSKGVAKVYVYFLKAQLK